MLRTERIYMSKEKRKKRLWISPQFCIDLWNVNTFKTWCLSIAVFLQPEAWKTLMCPIWLSCNLLFSLLLYSLKNIAILPYPGDYKCPGDWDVCGAGFEFCTGCVRQRPKAYLFLAPQSSGGRVGRYRNIKEESHKYQGKKSNKLMVTQLHCILFFCILWNIFNMLNMLFLQSFLAKQPATPTRASVSTSKEKSRRCFVSLKGKGNDSNLQRSTFCI